MDQVPAILLFDDGQGSLGPLSDLRVSFEQRTGGLTAIERAAAFGAPIRMAAAAGCAALLAERHGAESVAACTAALCINGRVHAGARAMREAFDGLAAGKALVSADGAVIAVRLAGAALTAFVSSIHAGKPALPADVQQMPCALPTWSRPWHLLNADVLGAAMAVDMEQVSGTWPAAERGALPAHVARAGNGALHLHASATIGIGVVFDTSTGPILVDRGAEVRHGSVITGPAWIGPKCIVMDRSVIKARTVLGPQCRGAGEIGSAIFQACSNKAHDGHLGDALLGEWVNLGAGTVNSNLLNTYGEVAMRLSPDAPLERTGRQFMGCIVGDHVKLAIGTRVMTGTSISTGTMWASGKAVSGAVGSFAWVTDDGERRFRLDKFMDIARTVMARRGREPGAAECARLSALHGAGAG